MMLLLKFLLAIITFTVGTAGVLYFAPLPGMLPVDSFVTGHDIFEDVSFAELMKNRDQYEGHLIRTRIVRPRWNDVGLDLSDPDGHASALLGVCRTEENCYTFVTRHPELLESDREVIVTGVFYFRPSTCGYGSAGTIVIYNITPADAVGETVSVPERNQ